MTETKKKPKKVSKKNNKQKTKLDILWSNIYVIYC